MKYVILLILCFCSCKPKEISDVNKPSVDALIFSKTDTLYLPAETIIIRDTIYIEKKYDSLVVVIKKKNDSLFVERYKLERVRYYNRLAIKNKSQLKFLSGWINRATK